MNGADEQLKTDLDYSLPRHGDPPIIHAVLYEEYLRVRSMRTHTKTIIIKILDIVILVQIN
jgi:hypothetical protein